MRKPLICLQPCNYKYALTKQHLKTDLNKHYSHIKVVIQKNPSVCVCGIQSKSSYASIVLREGVVCVWFLFF